MCIRDSKGTKINVIDTPGHADFGGEVERVLRMADGALLLVDAFEGPMPQTRFVLKNAIEAGLSIMVVVNKIDRPGARPEEVVNDVLDLMCDLGASDDQLAFSMEHVIFASAMNGYARLDPADDNDDMYPLLDMIVDEMPAPDVDVDAPLAMQVVNVDHDNFLGRIGVGRIYGGTIHKGCLLYTSHPKVLLSSLLLRIPGCPMSLSTTQAGRTPRRPMFLRIPPIPRGLRKL